MFDVFKISFYEYKKIFSKKGVYITLGILFLFFLLSVEQMLKVQVNSASLNPVLLINMMFVGIMQFLVMFRASSVLPEEFRCGTTSFIFTSTKSRTQILLSKILAFGLFGMTVGFMNFILIAYYQITKGLPVYYGGFLVTVVLYFIYSWFLGNYFLFFTVILKSCTTSFITGLFFLYLLNDFILQLAKKIVVANKFLDFIPFCNAFNFLLDGTVNSNKIIGMLTGGVIFFVLSVFIFEKQDLA